MLCKLTRNVQLAQILGMIFYNSELYQIQMIQFLRMHAVLRLDGQITFSFDKTSCGSINDLISSIAINLPFATFKILFTHYSEDS